MHPQAQIPGGLRLACADLPPALQPHAILAAAPRPDRRTSALGALTVYLAAAAGMVLLGRQAPRVLLPAPGRTGPPIILEPEPAARVEPPARVPAALANTDPLPQVRPFPQALDQPPEAIPQRLPSEDHSRDGVRAATDAELRAGRVEPVPAGNTRTTAGPGTIHELHANPPRILHAENPQYPPLARASRVQGPVELLMTIDERGLPTQVQVLSGHPAFHAEAERAARQWRFEAATQEGRAVAARFRLTILFRLG